MTIDPAFAARITQRLAGAVAGLTFGLAAALALAQDSPRTFVLHDTPKPVPQVDFQDGDGNPRSLADFRGKVVLLNVWATWCGPCRREMPTLDRLQAQLGGPDFEVAALSIDRAGIGVVRSFYAEVGVEHLAMYVDSSGKAARQLGAFGLPTTLLIDRKGREAGRLVGPAEWDTPEMVAFIRRYLSEESGAVPPGAASEWAGDTADRPIALTAPLRTLRPMDLDLPVTGDTTSPATN